ncbi:helix-turn-helix domain-containing protein [Mycolicibacterium sp. jd]|uniref:helix-turn-helix domain-containing protein n=1 Tax=Mycolicibacterium TaxID=1866885 RepID=UPI001F268E09|nr:helix-turn-helix transcriptional regulator [Mycolicibacterium vanbaalenii]WND56334.1 helix-turn-helix transcriptional regulator [Mycolicibacterium vanbaalenii]
MMANVADANRELADFLKRARSAVDPARAGLPADGRIRRVPGLRREEVALLAGVSTDYYARLEQGRRITPSAAVLDAIARALDLGDTGRAHLGRLVGASPTRRRSSRPVQRVRPGLYQLLDSLDGTPAMILGRRTDVLATNRAARVLFADFDAMPPRERNYARWMFTSEQARNLFVDWSIQARTAVENLRLDFGGDPHDPAVIELVDELSAVSLDFSSKVIAVERWGKMGREVASAVTGRGGVVPYRRAGRAFPGPVGLSSVGSDELWISRRRCGCAARRSRSGRPIARWRRDVGMFGGRCG